MSARPGYGIRLASARQLVDGRQPAAVVEMDWPNGPVRISAHLGAADLPSEIPGRVRCLVTRGDQILVIWDRQGRADCFPGGGIHPGESLAEAAQREVWEETGWRIHVDRLPVLGWLHIDSLGRRDPEWDFPHPDAFMTVLHARASYRDEGPAVWTDVEGYVVRSEFTPLDDLPQRIREDPISAVFLEVALGEAWLSARRHGPSD